MNSYKRTILMLEQEKRELESKLAVGKSSRREVTPDLESDSEDLKAQVSDLTDSLDLIYSSDSLDLTDSPDSLDVTDSLDLIDSSDSLDLTKFSIDY